MDKYQTGVFSTTKSCDSSTDAISCLNVDRMRRRFVVTSFFLVAAVAYSWWLFGLFGVTIVNIFSSVNKIVLTSLDEYFSATVSNGWVVVRVRSIQLWSMEVFKHKFSQGSAATHSIFYYRFITTVLLSSSVKEFWKSVSIWTKLAAKI